MILNTAVISSNSPNGNYFFEKKKEEGNIILSIANPISPSPSHRSNSIQLKWNSRLPLMLNSRFGVFHCLHFCCCCCCFLQRKCIYLLFSRCARKWIKGAIYGLSAYRLVSEFSICRANRMSVLLLHLPLLAISRSLNLAPFRMSIKKAKALNT